MRDINKAIGVVGDSPLALSDHAVPPTVPGLDRAASSA
jgi:hypothetical protein